MGTKDSEIAKSRGLGLPGSLSPSPYAIRHCCAVRIQLQPITPIADCTSLVVRLKVTEKALYKSGGKMTIHRE